MKTRAGSKDESAVRTLLSTSCITRYWPACSAFLDESFTALECSDLVLVLSAEGNDKSAAVGTSIAPACSFVVVDSYPIASSASCLTCPHNLVLTLLPAWWSCRNPAAAAKLEAERKLKEGISGHRTGLPKKLLELFAANDPLNVLTPIRKKGAKLPYNGMAGLVGLFAQPGDEEYEPPPEVDPPPSPRRFRNPELKSQARCDYESKAEK